MNFNGPDDFLIERRSVGTLHPIGAAGSAKPCPNTEVRCHFVRVALFANAINSDCRPVFVFAKIVRKCERAVS